MSVTPVQVPVSTSVPTLTLAAGQSGGVAIANTIDPVNDYTPIYTSSATATQGINRNTYLGISSAPVGLTDAQTLTNKTLTNPTINAATLGGTFIGTYTFSGTPTFPASVVTLTGTQTLTNKTIQSPTITSPNITNASITADSVSGYTAANSGTIYGVSITAGTINGSYVTSASITSTQLATGAVGASNLASNAITLGYMPYTSNITPLSATTTTEIVQFANTVTIATASRKVKVTWMASVTPASGIAPVFSIWRGAVGSGMQLQLMPQVMVTASNPYIICLIGIDTAPTVGSVTYRVGYSVPSSSIAINAASGAPSFSLVEAI